MEYKFTADNFQQEVLNSSQPVMVDFFANWCGPCQMMGPVIANLAEEYAGKIKIGKINVDENPGVARPMKSPRSRTWSSSKMGKWSTASSASSRTMY
mgnify:FL=1